MRPCRGPRPSPRRPCPRTPDTAPPSAASLPDRIRADFLTTGPETLVYNNCQNIFLAYLVCAECVLHVRGDMRDLCLLDDGVGERAQGGDRDLDDVTVGQQTGRLHEQS